MKKLTLLLFTSLTLTGCFTTQPMCQQPYSQPQTVYIQQQREMPSSKLARTGLGSQGNAATSQIYGVREVDGGPTKYYNIQKY